MSIYILAQCVGFLGYIFYVSSPHLKNKKHILHLAFIGYVILSFQWYLLGQYSLMTLNLLAIITTATAIGADNNKRIKKYAPLLYPFGIALILNASTGTFIDAITITAFILSTRAKLSNNLQEFRKLAFCAGSILTISGIIALSYPAMIFNFCFAIGHASKLCDFNKISLNAKSWVPLKKANQLPTQ